MLERNIGPTAAAAATAAATAAPRLRRRRSHGRPPPPPPIALAAAIGLHAGALARLDIRESGVARGWPASRSAAGSAAGPPSGPDGRRPAWDRPTACLAGRLLALSPAPLSPPRPIARAAAPVCPARSRSLHLGRSPHRRRLPAPGRSDRPRRTVAIGIEHLLAVLAAKILPRRLARLDVGLGEFLAHVGVVVFHAVTVIGVVLPFEKLSGRCD